MNNKDRLHITVQTELHRLPDKPNQRYYQGFMLADNTGPRPWYGKIYKLDPFPLEPPLMNYWIVHRRLDEPGRVMVSHYTTGVGVVIKNYPCETSYPRVIKSFKKKLFRMKPLDKQLLQKEIISYPNLNKYNWILNYEIV